METKEQKLPKAFKKKWIAALRSGKYQQGQSYLHQEGQYCCLGVACVISGISEKEMGLKPVIRKQWKASKCLPDILKGTEDSNPVVDKVTEMNDGWTSEGQRSFNEIADWIEENL